MEISAYMVLKSRKSRYRGSELEFAGGRIISKKPENLGRDEISIKLNMKIPDAVFTRPTLIATIEIPEPKNEFTISPEVQEQVTEQLQESLGINIDLQVVAEDSE